MINISLTISEEELRDSCIGIISDFMYNKYGISFVNDISSDDRRLIYAKVGAALIDFAGSDEVM